MSYKILSKINSNVKNRLVTRQEDKKENSLKLDQIGVQSWNDVFELSRNQTYLNDYHSRSIKKQIVTRDLIGKAQCSSANGTT